MSRVGGSFRDPDGFVFEHEGGIYRALSAPEAAILAELDRGGHLRRWAEEGLAVGTAFVPPGPLADTLSALYPGMPAFLAHERLPIVTYPCEWSPAMLADAALLTLRLQEELLGLGLSLKDATAYNVQFRRGRPVFIDLSSVEKPARLDMWHALGQFYRMFLYPLLLARHAGGDLRGYFLANLDGRTTLQVGQAFSRFRRWSPSLLLDLGLPYHMERRIRNAPAATHPVSAAPGNPDIQRATLGRLAAKIGKLASSFRADTVWGDYVRTCSYDGTAERSKKETVAAFLRTAAPRTVLDLGCNTGDYSAIAAGAGAEVLAADFDISAIDQLYRRIRADKSHPAITPLVLDIANPTPGFGFMNRERPPFLERVGCDCVMALALLHHLLVGANFTLEMVRDLFAALARRHLILEFVPPSDPMFRKLVEFRQDLHAGLTPEAVLGALAPAFAPLESRPVAHSPRTLYLLERR